MLRCAAAFRHCGVCKNTPHSEGIARLACDLFTRPSVNGHFYDFCEDVNNG